MKKDLTRHSEPQESEVLDHSRDLVECVYRTAPAEYHRLVDSEHGQWLLQQQRTFNYGKLFIYAEFVVFRREFLNRFPEASQAACINAFSTLFMKNDISITNLLLLIEDSGELEQLEKGAR